MYQQLQDRLDRGEVIILDGAIGTELQRLGAPMHPIAWAAEANYTHPYTVRFLHEQYIRAGADIITTNTFSNLRHVLEAAGYGAFVREINVRAVALAQEARERAAGGRPVWIAGAIGNFGVGRDPSTGILRGGSRYGYQLPDDQAESYYRELADTLAEAGVDFFLLEHLSFHRHRMIALQAARATGLPVWTGFSVGHWDPRARDDRAEIRESVQRDLTLAAAVKEAKSHGPSGMTILHSRIAETTAALPTLLEHWQGPVALYPDPGRTDYTAAWQDRTIQNDVTVEAFVQAAKDWVSQGVQVIGGCCGFGVEYIKPLRSQLPERIARPRQIATSR